MQPRRAKQPLRFTVSYDGLLYATYLRAMGDRRIDLWSVTDSEGNAYEGLGRISGVGQARRRAKAVGDFEVTITPIGKWNLQPAD
jgi:hypothetical protein